MTLCKIIGPHLCTCIKTALLSACIRSRWDTNNHRQKSLKDLRVTSQESLGMFRGEKKEETFFSEKDTHLRKFHIETQSFVQYYIRMDDKHKIISIDYQ